MVLIVRDVGLINWGVRVKNLRNFFVKNLHSPFIKMRQIYALNREKGGKKI